MHGCASPFTIKTEMGVALVCLRLLVEKKVNNTIMAGRRCSVHTIPCVASPVNGRCRLTLSALRINKTKKKDERGIVIVCAPWIKGDIDVSCGISEGAMGPGAGPPLRWI
jgi:hypothetical protein